VAILASHIRAICFDAVGTLIFPEPAAHEVYATVGHRFGSKLDVEAIRARFKRAFAEEENRDLVAGLRTSEERERRRWHHIVGTVLDDVTDPAACFAELYEHFHCPQAWRCADHAGEVLGRLAEHRTLALASNYDHRLHAVVEGMPDLKPLSHLVISSEVGWRKPAVGFFGAVCDVLALPPEQILYVGDDLVNDYEGARAAGMAALLIDPARSGPAEISQIADLRELLE
jgi:putative hydrolase of the HAD superfamily